MSTIVSITGATPCAAVDRDDAPVERMVGNRRMAHGDPSLSRPRPGRRNLHDARRVPADARRPSQQRYGCAAPSRRGARDPGHPGRGSGPRSDQAHGPGGRYICPPARDGTDNADDPSSIPSCERSWALSTFRTSDIRLFSCEVRRVWGAGPYFSGRAGLPATVTPAGTSRVTTLPAPTIALSPTVMPGRISAAPPIQTFGPMVTDRPNSSIWPR